MKKIRLGRKAKKRLINECGRGEFVTQTMLIYEGLLTKYIVLP